MRRRMMSCLLTAAFLLQQPRPARAGGFATEFTQLLNHGQLLIQYIRQGEQLAEAFKQTADMVRHSLRFNDLTFGNVMEDIDRLAGVVQGGMALAYSMANLDGEFRARFRGYAYNSNAWYVNYRDWSQTALDTILGTLRAAGLQSRQLQDERSILTAIRGMATSAEGRMEALQVANQISEQTVEQLMKLRALMLADLQSKQAFQAHQVQKDAAIEAAVEQFLKYSRELSSGNRYQAGWK
jgi:P-type conjugative transfer protein TrbJ